MVKCISVKIKWVCDESKELYEEKSMYLYKSKRNITLILDMIGIALSFVIALSIRFSLLTKTIGLDLVVSTYVSFFAYALLIYVFLFLFKDNPRLERMSYKEIIVKTIERQFLFVVTYIVFFFVFHKADVISRLVIGIFFVANVVLCSIGRILYHNYCVYKSNKEREKRALDETNKINRQEFEGTGRNSIQHVYIIGSKSIGMYGGYESFVMNLLLQHKDMKEIKYHVACKANGNGYMNLSKLPGSLRINDSEFSYCGAHCFMISVPDRLGSMQAIYYDLEALKWACEHIERNHIRMPIVYILASRIGPFEKKYVERIHDAGGLVLQNPDGRENLRRKWSWLIRNYWKISERMSVKYADLVICDSKNIEAYIKDEYANYHPQTTFIAYGSHVKQAESADTETKYQSWLEDHGLVDGQFYISVGRFVPENNFDIMIREFMMSHTTKDYAIITTENEKYASQLQQKLQYKHDSRIKFVGAVYDTELITKIRNNAYGYFHGHEVGGTNPSLLEALGSTKLNLLYDVCYNREVGEDAALYWTKDEGNLAELIDKADKLEESEIESLGRKAKTRMENEYSWKLITDKYLEVFLMQ